jgi:hypothetical protein
MHPLAAFIVGMCAMALTFSAVQVSPTKGEIAHAFQQRDQAINILVDEINKLKKKK